MVYHAGHVGRLRPRVAGAVTTRLRSVSSAGMRDFRTFEEDLRRAFESGDEAGVNTALADAFLLARQSGRDSGDQTMARADVDRAMYRERCFTLERERRAVETEVRALRSTIGALREEIKRLRGGTER